MTTLTVEAGETGKIRVFAINKPADVLRADLTKMPKADLARALLGQPHLDTTSVEIFPVSDLAGVGIAAYLRDGYAVPEDALAKDAAKLAALDGYVMLVFSDSLQGAPETIEIGPDLTLIGTYAEPKANHSARKLTAQSAAPYTGAAPEAAKAPTKKGYGSSIIALVAIILVIALIWWALT